jgi:hypothetical protein
MRSLLSAAAIAALTIFGSTFIGLTPAKAIANLAFCLSFRDSTECDYATYEQCQATASGIGADCIANPDTSAIRSPAPPRASRRVSRRR